MNNRSVLFHASNRKDLDRIEPKRTMSNDKYIGDYVFASPDKRIAAMYLAPREGGSILMSMFDNEPYAVINNDPDHFIKIDCGGAIYEVPKEGFFETPQMDQTRTELVHNETVIPIRKEVFESSLDAMLQMGAKVHFLSGHEFESIKNAKDHGWAVLSKRVPFSH